MPQRAWLTAFGGPIAPKTPALKLNMVIHIREEPAVRIGVSPTLAACRDGQFWVGSAEHGGEGRYGAARKRRRNASGNKR